MACTSSAFFSRFRRLGWFSGLAVVLGTSVSLAEPPSSPAPGAPSAAPTTDPEPPAATSTPAETDAAPSDAPAEVAPGSPEAPAPADAAAPPAESNLQLTPPPAEAAPATTGVSGAPEQSKEPATRVFAEDWWSHSRPLFEIHGNFRVRAELFNKFALNRRDTPSTALWPRPADNYYTPINGGQSFGPVQCTPNEAGTGSGTDRTESKLVGCKNNTQAGANLRFRLVPELHISDNLRILSEIDLLDNVVLGSTPDSYSVVPSGYGYAVRNPDGSVAGNASQSTTTEPPASGVNSLSDSIRVKRAWAEYASPIGELRFGRMPNQWGLGMVYNSGDGYDSDYQSTVDRIMASTQITPLDLLVAGAWDFPAEGATSASLSTLDSQAYDLAQADDVNELVLIIARKKSKELEALALTKGELVLNTGLHLARRTQQLSNDQGSGDGAAAGAGTCQMGMTGAALDGPPGSSTFQRRGLALWIPDLWVQLLYKKFRYELEFASYYGTVENSTNDASDYSTAPGAKGYKIREFGLASELEQKLVEDRLKLGFNFGWASGDANDEGLAPARTPSISHNGSDTFSTFRFNPAYRVDLILNRNILGRVQGTYYFRPSVSYDFMRNPNGQRLGGQFAAIWTRASEFLQTPGNARDLGIELDGSLMFQSKDGGQNDKPDELGGFFAMLQYGVLFPMSGLDHLPQENGPSTNAAQVLRLHLGVLF